MTQFGTTGTAPRNTGITNEREILAFAVAELLKLALTYGLSLGGVLGPLYVWAHQTAGQSGIFAVSIAMNVVWGSLVLVAFLLFRGIFGGVPMIVAGSGRENAIASTGREIGAFVLADAIVFVVVFTVNVLVLVKLYLAFGRSLAPALGMGVAIVAAVALYVVFIGLRRAFGPARTLV